MVAAGPAISLRRPIVGLKTSGFGMRNGVLHAGIDLAAPTGTPVSASAAGVIEQARWNDGYGNYILINHGQHSGKKLATAYAHLSRISVKQGSRVVAGQTIGNVGSTGDSTGPHLHFEVRLDGVAQDPERYLSGSITIEPIVDASKGIANLGPTQILGDFKKLALFMTDRRSWLRLAMLILGASLLLAALAMMIGSEATQAIGLIEKGRAKGSSAATGETVAGGMST